MNRKKHVGRNKHVFDKKKKKTNIFDSFIITGSIWGYWFTKSANLENFTLNPIARYSNGPTMLSENYDDLNESADKSI